MRGRRWLEAPRERRRTVAPRTGTPAIVLDVDDTSLATWNYEIFSNWAYNPVTNATYVTGAAVPGGSGHGRDGDPGPPRATRSST